MSGVDAGCTGAAGWPTVAGTFAGCAVATVGHTATPSTHASADRQSWLRMTLPWRRRRGLPSSQLSDTQKRRTAEAGEAVAQFANPLKKFRPQCDNLVDSLELRLDRPSSFWQALRQKREE